jgi:hypothetical protein
MRTSEGIVARMAEVQLCDAHVERQVLAVPGNCYARANVNARNAIRLETPMDSAIGPPKTAALRLGREKEVPRSQLTAA